MKLLPCRLAVKSPTGFLLKGALFLSFLNKIIATVENIEWVFVYSTLMNKKLRSKILKKETDEIDDTLSGYKAISVNSDEGKDFHTLIKDPKDEVLGKRFRISDKDLKKLDAWEDEYKRVFIILNSGITAWVYILKKENFKDVGHSREMSDKEAFEGSGFKP